MPQQQQTGPLWPHSQQQPADAHCCTRRLQDPPPLFSIPQPQAHRTAVHRRRRGGTPPPPWTPTSPPFLPFQCLRLTAKILHRRLQRQEDLSLKNSWPAFGADHRGTLGGGGSQPNLPPFRPPPLPPGGRGKGARRCAPLSLQYVCHTRAPPASAPGIVCVGHTAHGVLCGRHLFCSGQCSWDAAPPPPNGPGP